MQDDSSVAAKLLPLGGLVIVLLLFFVETDSRLFAWPWISDAFFGAAIVLGGVYWVGVSLWRRRLRRNETCAVCGASFVDRRARRRNRRNQKRCRSCGAPRSGVAIAWLPSARFVNAALLLALIGLSSLMLAVPKHFAPQEELREARGVVAESRFEGSSLQLTIRQPDGNDLKMAISPSHLHGAKPQPGDRVEAKLDAHHAVAFARNGETVFTYDEYRRDARTYGRRLSYVYFGATIAFAGWLVYRAASRRKAASGANAKKRSKIPSGKAQETVACRGGLTPSARQKR